MSLELFLGKDHVDYKNYIEHHNIVIDAIDELTYLSNTLDYNRLVVFFKEVVETFEYFKNIDEKDDNSEGFSNMNNKENLFLSIIDCDEYNNLIQFMVSYKETIIRKSEKLKKKIEDLLEFKIFVEPPSNTEDTQPNKYIERVYDDNVKLILSKMDDISEKLQNNIYEQLPYIDERKVKFDIKLITKNDIICILSSYRFLKMFVYKHMHVIDREYYTATKEDVLEFRKELYDIYTMLREHFNREKNLYVEDILAKFKQALEVVVKLEISKDVKDGGGSEAGEAGEAGEAVVTKTDKKAKTNVNTDDDVPDTEKADDDVPDDEKADDKKADDKKADDEKADDKKADDKKADDKKADDKKADDKKADDKKASEKAGEKAAASVPAFVAVAESDTTAKEGLLNPLEAVQGQTNAAVGAAAGAVEQRKEQLAAQGKAVTDAAKDAENAVREQLAAQRKAATEAAKDAENAVREQLAAQRKAATEAAKDAEKAVRGQVQAISGAAAGLQNSFTSTLSRFGSIKEQAGQALTPAGFLALASGQHNQSYKDNK
jgi:hypothetical protein